MCKVTELKRKIMKKRQLRRQQAWFLTILSILWSLSLAACSAGESSDGLGEAVAFEGSTLEESALEGDPITAKDTSPGTLDADGAAPVVNLPLNDSSLGDISAEDIFLDDCPGYVFSTGEGQLLLVGEGLALLDCSTLEIVGQNHNPGLDFDLRDLSSCKLTVLDQEYILLGNWLDMGKAEALGNGTFVSTSSKMPELKMILIGKDLQVMEVINMNEVLGAERDISAFALIEQGAKLIFAEDYNGLYVYNRNTGKRSECIDFYNSLEGRKEGGIQSVSSIQYAESTGQILFTGSYYDSKKKEFLRTVGQVNINGSGLSYEKEGVNAYGDLWYYDGSVLIEDMEFRGRGEVGTAFYYDRNKELHIHSLADEYAGLQPSERGNYFAVQSVEWSEEGTNIGYTVRIYALKSGQLMQEISLPRTEIGENAILSECVICEDTGIILMFLQDRGTDENAHIKVESLSM